MSRPPLLCADRSGFLFAHACDRPAVGACSSCGKAICMEHARMASAGPTCITCLRGESDPDRDRSHSSTRDRDSDSSSSSGPSTDESPQGMVVGGGKSGGAGASGDWQEGPPEVARADDPFFFQGVNRAAYYDADDHAAFDTLAIGGDGGDTGDTAAGGDDDRDADSEAPDTDTGAS